MLPIMAKLNVILKPGCVNTWEFWHSLGKELHFAIKEHHFFCNHLPDFEDSPLLNRDHPPLNKNKQSLPLELFLIAEEKSFII